MAKSKPTTELAPADSIPTINKGAPILIELLAMASSSKDVAANYVIDSQEMYDIAAESLRDIHNAAKRCEEEKEKISKPQYAAWKATNALFNPIAEALESAKKALGRKMHQFETTEKAKRDAAEQAAELKRQQEIAATQANLEAAREAVEQGTGSLDAFEAASAAAMVAEIGVSVAHVSDPVSRSGHAGRKRWEGEVTNLPDFLEWLAKRLRMNDVTFDNTIDIKYGQINAFGTSTQGTGKIPGVVFHDASTIIARS